MSLKTVLDALPPQQWGNETVYFRKITTEAELIYAAYDCRLTDEQKDLVNPAWFSIGRAYLAPDDHYPCIIYNSEDEKIGFICLSKWLGEGDALSWSFFLDQTEQGKGYGRAAARLAIAILQSVSGGKMIKVATEPSNEKAQRLYRSFGLDQLDELDGDDLVFGK